MTNATIFGYCLAICTGILITLELLVVKYYQQHFSVNHNIFTALFWTYALGTVVSLIVMGIFETPQFPNTTEQFLFTGGHIFTYVFIMPLLMHGVALTSGNTCNIISTMSIVIMLIAQYTILKDIYPGHRNWIEILGVILVLGGSIFSSVVDIFRSYGKENLEK